MSTNRSMDKEDVVCIGNGILLSQKKNKIVTFEAIWMDLEIVMLSKMSEKDKYHITYMWNLKK